MNDLQYLENDDTFEETRLQMQDARKSLRKALEEDVTPERLAQPPQTIPSFEFYESEAYRSDAPPQNNPEDKYDILQMEMKLTVMDTLRAREINLDVRTERDRLRERVEELEEHVEELEEQVGEVGTHDTVPLVIMNEWQASKVEELNERVKRLEEELAKTAAEREKERGEKEQNDKRMRELEEQLGRMNVSSSSAAAKPRGESRRTKRLYKRRASEDAETVGGPRKKPNVDDSGA